MSWHHSIETTEIRSKLDIAYVSPTKAEPCVQVDVWDLEDYRGMGVDLTPAQAHELADWIKANVPLSTQSSERQED